MFDLEESITFTSNPYLKKPYQKQNYTSEQIMEMYKCANDPEYFFKNYYWVTTTDGEEKLFEPYVYQERVLKSLLENRFVIGMMPRQCGKTTIIVAFFLWITLFHDNRRILFLSKDLKSAIDLLGRVKFAYERIPLWMQQGVHKNAASMFEFENNSGIHVKATTPDAGRGGSYYAVFSDEFAMVPPNIAEDFFAATFPTVSGGKESKFIIISTPKGMNKFYEEWSKAKQGKSPFKTVESTWDEHPDRDKKWLDEQRETLGEALFHQEILCKFLGSSGTLISPSFLETIEIKEPLINKDGEFKIWELPEAGHRYVLCCDVSEGVGRDYSVFTVIDVTEEPYRIVAKYRNNKTKIFDAPIIIHDIGRKYNTAYILIETGGGSRNIGGQIADQLWYDLGYENMICTSSTKGSRREVTFAPSSGGKSMSFLGVKMLKNIKQRGCANLKQIIEDGMLIFWDADFIKEFSTFRKEDGPHGSFSAEPPNNDDCVMTLVLFGWLADRVEFSSLNEIALESNIQEYNFLPAINTDGENLYEDVIVEDHLVWQCTGRWGLY